MKDKGRDTACYAGEVSKGSNKGGRGLTKDVECYNCHKKGHKKADCWVKGGGKEGQGPRSKKLRDAGGMSGNYAEDKDGVWMAFTEEDWYGDNKEDCDEEDSDVRDEEDLWYLTTGIDKSLTKPSDRPDSNLPYSLIDCQNFLDHAGYASDDSDDMPSLITVLDPSDNNNMPALVTLTESSDSSDNNSNGNPLALRHFLNSSDDEFGLYMVKDAECNSMPDLQMCSDSSEDVDGGEDYEMQKLVEDDGDKAYTRTYDCAMLVNVAGKQDGVKTELYDSGASHHMSPYQHHFLNYVSIVPKSITAADKHCFQAIGKGDLRIHVPKGRSMTTILLKDVLHCPDMGLTLISISKAAAAGFPSLFRGLTCRIFNKRNKLIGEVKARNRLYRVDNKVT